MPEDPCGRDGSGSAINGRDLAVVLHDLEAGRIDVGDLAGLEELRAHDHGPRVEHRGTRSSVCEFTAPCDGTPHYPTVCTDEVEPMKMPCSM